MSRGGVRIENISDTARWVAMYRAFETERPDAHFRDPYARRLAGPNGEKIVRSIPGGRRSAWPMVVRTVALDEFLLRGVRDEGVGAVLNLAAGLDARPWRLPLPASLRWIDVDLPEILGYKQRELANDVPRCRYEARAADLRDPAARRALFRDAGGAGEDMFVLCEGLLIYLTEAEVTDLARDLAAEPSFRWWAIDLVSPALLARLSRRWGRTLARGNAPFQFAPASGTRFFEPLGWTEREFRSTFEDATRLKRRMPNAWVYDLLGLLASPARRQQWQRFAGNVLMASKTPRGAAARGDAS